MSKQKRFAMGPANPAKDETHEGADHALHVLVRLLARIAAREAIAASPDRPDDNPDIKFGGAAQ